MMFDSAIATASPLPSIDENSVLVPSTTDGLSHVAPQTVQLYWEVSGGSLGRKVPIPRQCDWGKVVAALHYRAGRRWGVPIWCIRLRWPSNPWEPSQLPLDLKIACTVCISDVDVWKNDERMENEVACMLCFEDCEDADSSLASRSRYDNCVVCHPCFLCDRCRVTMPGGVSYCLDCFTGDDDAYSERVHELLQTLTPAQQRRWHCVRAIRAILDTWGDD